jgi:hypothetical protein
MSFRWFFKALIDCQLSVHGATVTGAAYRIFDLAEFVSHVMAAKMFPIVIKKILGIAIMRRHFKMKASLAASNYCSEV